MKTVLLKVDPENIDKSVVAEAAGYIKAGGLVAFPTETVYGLGALALDERAVSAVFAAKGRPQDNPLIAHIADASQLSGLVREIPPEARALMEAFWPGPLTLLFPRHEKLPGFVTRGLDTVAVRMPSNPVARAFLRAVGAPVSAPSANLSGSPSPTRAQHVLHDLGGKIDAILDGGDASFGVESTVLDLTRRPAVILRPGGVTLEQLAAVLGDGNVVAPASTHQPPVATVSDATTSVAAAPATSFKPPFGKGVAAKPPGVCTSSPSSPLDAAQPEEPPRSPGVKYRHYAPRAALQLLCGPRTEISRRLRLLLAAAPRPHTLGALCSRETLFELSSDPAVAKGGAQLLALGAANDPAAAASALFAALRELDQRSVERAYCEAWPTAGIGAALRDRMAKAAGGNILDVGDVRSILFVCTGNTCRSPMAEALFNHLASTVANRARAASAASAASADATNPAAPADATNPSVPPDAPPPAAPADAAPPAIVASSAGIYASGGEPASRDAIATLRDQYGIDLSGHRARALTPALLDGADLVLAMTRAHRDAILARHPQHAAKTFALLDYAPIIAPQNGGITANIAANTLSPDISADASPDIADPYGLGPAAYRACAARLRAACAHFFNFL